jgi:hypothetical protein
VDGIEGTFGQYCDGLPANRLYERSGVFALTVTVDGYLPWHTGDLHVQKDDCHVGTVQLYVPMTRQ